VGPSWFVYIVHCSDNSFYTGITTDPKQRELDHRNGKGGKYTKSHKVLKMIYTEEVASKSEALKRELQIKGWTREKKINILNLNI
jgi:putative endonuclease